MLVAARQNDGSRLVGSAPDLSRPPRDHAAPRGRISGCLRTTGRGEARVAWRDVDVWPLTEERLEDFEKLQSSQPQSVGCWCMWFVRRVADYHEGGSAGNRAALLEVMRSAVTPVGFLAYDGETAVGWCSAGPRARYARALKTPTLRGRDASEDDDVWFVPCFLVHPDRRGEGVASTLLEHVVDAAAHEGAVAVEGFPLSGARRRSSSADFMTGTESLFASCGFVDVRRPSDNRVIMRRSLRGRSGG